MSKAAQDIELARRAYVASLGTQHEKAAREALEKLVEKARQR